MNALVKTVVLLGSMRLPCCLERSNLSCRSTGRKSRVVQKGRRSMIGHRSSERAWSDCRRRQSIVVGMEQTSLSVGKDKVSAVQKGQRELSLGKDKRALTDSFLRRMTVPCWSDQSRRSCCSARAERHGVWKETTMPCLNLIETIRIGE